MVDRYRVGRVFLAGTRRMCIRRREVKGSTRACRMRTTWDGSSGTSLRGGPDSLLDTYEAERLPIAAAVLGLSKRCTKRDRSSAATHQPAGFALQNEPPVFGRHHSEACIPAIACLMRGWTMAADSSIICAVRHATELGHARGASDSDSSGRLHCAHRLDALR
jgi:hypothetical protein